MKGDFARPSQPKGLGSGPGIWLDAVREAFRGILAQLTLSLSQDSTNGFWVFASVGPW